MRCRNCGLDIVKKGANDYWAHADPPFFHSCEYQEAYNRYGEVRDNVERINEAAPMTKEENIEKLLCAVDSVTDL